MTFMGYVWWSLLGLVVLILGTISGVFPEPVCTFTCMLIRQVKGKKRTSFNFDKVDEYVYLGRQPPSKAAMAELQRVGIKACVSVIQPWEFLLPASDYKAQGWDWLNVPAIDYAAPSPADVQKAVNFLESNIEQKLPTYVHCNAGKGRSAVVVAAYLMRKNGWDMDKAAQELRLRRPVVSKYISFWPFSPQARALRTFGLEMKRSD